MNILNKILVPHYNTIVVCDFISVSVLCFVKRKFQEPAAHCLSYRLENRGPLLGFVPSAAH